MHPSHELQELADFFSGRDIPGGPQHINQYSLFLNLSGAVDTQLLRLHSNVEATQRSAIILLREVKEWLISQDAAK